MLTDRKILGKLEKIEQRYAELRFEKVADVAMEMCETREHFRQEPGPEARLKWRPAYELNVPVIVCPASRDTSGFDGLVAIGAPNVIVEAVKWAEQGKALVLRIYEAGNIGGKVGIRFNAPVRAVSETDLLEENPRELALDGRGGTTFLAPFEIKTLYCTV